MPVHLGERSYSVGHRNDFDGDVVVGKYTSIARGVTFLCGQYAMHASAGTKYVSNFPFSHVDKGPIIIGNDVWIGTNVIILAGVEIGHGAIVGAGAVISKNVPPYAVVVGNPQRIAKWRYSPEIVQELLRIKWWDWGADIIDSRKDDFNDICMFLSKYGCNQA